MKNIDASMDEWITDYFKSPLGNLGKEEEEEKETDCSLTEAELQELGEDTL